MTDDTQPTPDSQALGGEAADPLAPIPDQADFVEPPASPAPAASPDLGVDLDALTAQLSSMASRVTPWDLADYLPAGVFGMSAKKLSESFISPLVAAARGYRSFNETNISEIGPAFGAVDKRNRQMRRVYDAAGRSDVMLMPWFAVDTIITSATRPGGAKHDSLQFRPGKLPPEVEGVKQRKYEFLTGDQTPIAVHPSVPVSWIETSEKVLLAEGLLKGDAALTGYLLHHGFTKADLSFRGDVEPREALRAMLNTIPEEDRLAIFTMAGVWNWRQNHEWNSLYLKDREVWVGVDGDVATKPGVFKATQALWGYLEEKKKATVKLLSPIISMEDNGGDAEKVGIDDYLAMHGTWAQLLECLSPTLPPKPADLKAKEGDARIDADGCSASQYVISEKDAAGNPIDGRWVSFVPLGGRINSTVAERIPTDQEIASGAFGAGVSESSIIWEVEVEISFRNGMGQIETHTITGPHHILNYLPEKWHDKGAHIPGPVMVHPEWPPRGKDAEAWIRAVKGHDQEKTVRRTRWACMGWVPVPGGVPAYIAGSHVIGGADAESENEEVIPGVTNDMLDRADSFGAGRDSGLTYDSPEYREEVRVAIEAVMEVYVTNKVWTDRRNAAVVIAAGLRPALPIRPKAIPYFTGSRGTGKTYSAEACIAFWQSRPGSLIPVPGSAKDTPAAMELSVARSNLWVIDDLAPASSKRQSEDEKDKIGNLIRNQFNGAAKGRSNANMEARKKNNPRALLVLTAENEPTVSSELDRLILCDIGHGALNKETWPTDELTKMVETGGKEASGAPALVSQALVKYLRWCAVQPGSSWEQVYKLVKQSFDYAAKEAEDGLGSRGKKRHANISADLTMVYHWLRQIAVEVGCSDTVLDLLNSVDGLPADIVDLVGTTAQENQGTSPGRALTEALSAVLRRGRAHILSADDPTALPADPQSEKARLRALGWINTGNGDEWKPVSGSDPIGWLVEEKGEKVIIFDLRTAFSVAQQYSDGLIPHGQGYRSSWASVTGEGFGMKEMLRPRDGGKLLNSCRKMTNGTTRTGYPMALDQVLRGGLKDGEHRDLDHHEADPDAE